MTHAAPVVLGPRLVGERLQFSESRVISIDRLLGEGGFSYVYLVSDVSPGASAAMAESEETPSDSNEKDGGSNAHSSAAISDKAASKPPEDKMVLKITTVQNQEQREIARKEAMLLKHLSHPSIVKLFEDCVRSTTRTSLQQHMLLMEYCSEGHAFSVIQQMKAANQRFTLQNLIIAFGQICNAVSYLHAQKPHIVHRDLKLENFLVCPGNCYKLCDFGSVGK